MLIFSCYLDYNSEQITQNIYCETQKRYSFATKQKDYVLSVQKEVEVREEDVPVPMLEFC